LRLLTAALAGMLGGLPALAAGGHVPQIWFCPKQSTVDMSLAPGRRITFEGSDFAALLPAGAPWQSAASHVSVLTVSLHTIEHFPDLPGIIAMARRNGFKLATAGGMLYTNGVCQMPRHIEGINESRDYAQETVAAIRKWKQFGGRLDYIIFDGPFFYGYYASARFCHFSIADVARMAAKTLAEIRKIYPDIETMDAEGPGPTPVAEWLPEYQEFLTDFAQESGRQVDAVGMDLKWTDKWHTGYDWVRATARITRYLHGQGIKAGLYIKADDEGVYSSHDWLNSNRLLLQNVAATGIPLDFLYIVSWLKYPDRNLPDSDPDAYASLINDAYADFQRQPAAR
jgi:hypothetical protein